MQEARFIVGCNKRNYFSSILNRFFQKVHNIVRLYLLAHFKTQLQTDKKMNQSYINPRVGYLLGNE
jgi:hypothetical protein